MLSAPYHPATNGEAERFVQTFKHALKAARLDPGTLETKLARFLLSYRTTHNATTNVSPAEFLFKGQIRTKLTIVVPKVSSTVSYKQAAQKKWHEKKAKQRDFIPSQAVKLSWLKTIVERRNGYQG